MEHTKEPWRVYTWGEDFGVQMGDAGGFMLDPLSNPEANAHRIVACVNACAGISNEVLEQYAALMPAVEHCKELEKQRDELLAELLRVKEICLRECGVGIVNEVVIASVKEAQP